MVQTKKICTACGTQFPISYTDHLCAICMEERQYVPAAGQEWTSHDILLKTHATEIKQLNDKLYEICITPKFAIGQRAFLLISEHGNILWDCIPLLDENVIDFIRSKGGLKAIAFSHPHYYSNMNDWADLFRCPVYIHKNDEPYISEKGNNILLWEENELPLWDGMCLINIGGHFAGSTILLHTTMSEKGTVLCGDTFYLSPSMKHFAVMYSYPNRIPLPLKEIKRIKEQVKNINFDSVYGFYPYQNLPHNAKEILMDSLERYLQ
ncbi:hypothetical protein [Chryseobacterium sp. JV558]|uniref:hypothetical protein n=1 Tax=Chryseobacterium sp. JV558 TaxID=2663236 RepID=UPI00299D6D73|nr:hypothetical protein [Chryseobacterium sp. JV558]MDW9378695.1 MBL fold metallo-hydrolase [Chryseobacterium sp. JV558]